jgi:hypothetical protein
MFRMIFTAEIIPVFSLNGLVVIMGMESELGKVRFFFKSFTLRSVISASLFSLFRLMSTHVILFVASDATNTDYLVHGAGSFLRS